MTIWSLFCITQRIVKLNALKKQSKEIDCAESLKEMKENSLEPISFKRVYLRMREFHTQWFYLLILVPLY